MTCWTHIILEGHCLYSFISKKTHKYCSSKDISKPHKDTKWKVNKNEDYIPKSKRPNWCKDKNKKLTPQFRCLCSGKKQERCVFFGFTNANKSDYNLFNKVYDEKYKD